MENEDLKRLILKMVKINELHGYEVQRRLESHEIKVEMSRLYRVLGPSQHSLRQKSALQRFSVYAFSTTCVL